MATVALTGSEKQIIWADRIRAEQLGKVAAFLAGAEVQAQKLGQSEQEIADGVAPYRTLEARLASKVSASWWIDHRDDTARLLLLAVQREG